MKRHPRLKETTAMDDADGGGMLCGLGVVSLLAWQEGEGPNRPRPPPLLSEIKVCRRLELTGGFPAGKPPARLPAWGGRRLSPSLLLLAQEFCLSLHIKFLLPSLPTPFLAEGEERRRKPPPV